MFDAFLPESCIEIVHLYMADGNLFWRAAFEQRLTEDSKREHLTYALESWNQALSLCYAYDFKKERATRVLLRNMIRLHIELELPFRRRAAWIYRDTEHKKYGTDEEERQYLKAQWHLAEKLGNHDDAAEFNRRLLGER